MYFMKFLMYSTRFHKKLTLHVFYSILGIADEK